MPDIILNIPANSRFKSSLGEIDLAFNQIFLKMMRLADPRSNLGKQYILANESTNNWLWNNERVFQVDDLDTEEIFNTYLLRKNVNKAKGVDVHFPLLAYTQKDIETVFWGTGNRYKQWEFTIPTGQTSTSTQVYNVKDEVVVVSPVTYRGLLCNIEKITSDSKYILSYNSEVLKELLSSGKKLPMEFSASQLKKPEQKYSTFKAKAITGKYNAVILCDTKDEAQYIRDKFILRCADANIWFKYLSPTIDNTENQIFTVFGIPNLEKYPTSKDKIEGTGYVYGIGFDVDYWGCLTDEPLPTGFIETIRMNINVERTDGINRIVIS